MSRENATAASANPASASAAASQSMPDAAPNPQMHTSVHGKVQLMHYLNHAIAVGVGQIASFDPTVNVLVGEGNCKVWVEEALIPSANLFRQTLGASTIGEAVGSTISWPI